MSLREVCTCGHEKATHFGEKHEGACLGLGCNVTQMNCLAYRDVNDPTPSTIPPTQRSSAHRPVDPRKDKPHAQWECRCGACRAWARAKHGYTCGCHLCFP